MSSLLQRYATPLTAGLFLVSLISGVALFFHVWPSVFHGMHEWLSMLLIAPFVLHLWRNWRPMIGYFAKPAFSAAMAVCLVAALGFAVASAGAGGRRGPAQFALVDAITSSTAAKLAPALGTDADALVATLKARGFANAVADARLTDIAANSGKDAGELASALAAAAGK
jgi:hypothetical protein